MKSEWLLLALSFVLVGVPSCNCQRTERCEWHLEYDEKNMDLASSGFVAMCIRNYELGKQKCYLEIEENRAKHASSGPVIYRDVDIDETTMPRRIRQYQHCQP